MAIEVEKKYRLTKDQYAEMERRLGNTDAHFLGRVFERNILFSNDDLRQRAAFVRLRQTDETTIITFKQKLAFKGGLKSQLEFETEVEDFEAILQIISLLGLKKVIVYEKRRSTWNLDDTEIVLDELPFGFYMEIEGEVDGIETVENKVVTKDIAAEHETYPMLTKRHGELIKGVARAVFEDQ